MARSKNAVLAEWVRRSGWSHHEVARRVIAEAEAQGLHHVRPTHTNVRTWLAGTQPRKPVPALLAEVLGRHFGLTLTAADLGLDTSVSSVLHGLDLPWRAEPTVEATEGLTKADLMISRREAAGELAGIAVGAALLDPLRHWLTAQPAPTPAQVRGHRIGMSDVAEIEHVTTIFRALDNRHGAGMRRKAVIGQLSEVNDLLAHSTHTAPVGRRLRTATADLCGLAAWMSFDAGHHTTAQRYWTLAIHHAHDADNPALAAYLMCEMAAQMRFIGRPQDALSLLQMAQYRTANERCPQLRSLLGQDEADARAGMGDASGTYRALGQSEEAITAESGDPAPEFIAYFGAEAVIAGRGSVLAELAMHQEGAARRRSLDEARTTLADGIAATDERFGRKRARHMMDLVSVHITAGDYDEAATAAEQLAHTMTTINSPRTVMEIGRVRARLANEPSDPRVRAVADHLDSVTRGKD